LPRARRARDDFANARAGKTFVTTNYDEWLDDEIVPPTTDVEGEAGGSADVAPRARTVYFKPEDLTAANLNRQDVVIHLHGSVKSPGGMILTTPHYVQHYANDRKAQENIVLTFLEGLFRDKTVLFIGYGLAELEILEYLVVKTRTKVKSLQPRHFLLQGFYSHERELMVSMRGCTRSSAVLERHHSGVVRTNRSDGVSRLAPHSESPAPRLLGVPHSTARAIET
jgi:SIR2-like protein